MYVSLPPSLFLSPSFQCVADDTVCVFILSTYTDGAPPETASWFCRWLEEAKDDFRVNKALLSGLHFSAFGLGDSLYGENYNRAAKEFVEGLKKLSAVCVHPLGLGDQNVAQSTHSGMSIYTAASVFVLSFRECLLRSATNQVATTASLRFILLLQLLLATFTTFTTFTSYFYQLLQSCF